LYNNSRQWQQQRQQLALDQYSSLLFLPLPSLARFFHNKSSSSSSGVGRGGVTLSGEVLD
jgi:hypothetical protein